MNQKTLLAAGLALACSLSAPVFGASSIMFDPDGDGVDILEVGSFDWSPSSTLSVDSVPTSEGDVFDVYSHAALGTVSNTSGVFFGPSGLNTDYEITFIAGFTETIVSTETKNFTLDNLGADGVLGGGDDEYSFTQSISLSLADPGDQNINFFEIYYDDLSDGGQHNPLEGTGFNDGVLILSATVFSLTGNFDSNIKFVDANNNGQFDPGDDTLLTVDLDQFGDLDNDGIAEDEWDGQQTVKGQGATDLDAEVTFQEGAFFIDGISTLIQELFFNTENIVPFLQTNPSRLFTDENGDTVISPDLGTVNGGNFDPNSPTDFLLQTDANNSFTTTTVVPEPNTVLLFGLGLLLLGYGSRRHYLRRS